MVERLRELGLSPQSAQPETEADLCIELRDRSKPLRVVFAEPPEQPDVEPNDRDAATMVAQPFVTPSQGKRYRAIGIPFVDAAGNAWLDTPSVHIRVEGRRLPPNLMAEIRRSAPTREDALTATGLQVVFVLLTTPEFVSAPVRVIARASGVSLGSAQTAIRALDARGHLVGGGKGRHDLRRVEELTNHWLIGFQNQLLPKLQESAFVGPDPDWWALAASDDAFTGVLSGEAVVKEWLKPTTTLVYGAWPWEELRVAARLRRGPVPNVLLRKMFWDPTMVGSGTRAPDLLIYADLLASGDSRQAEAARNMRKGSRDLRKLLD